MKQSDMSLPEQDLLKFQATWFLLDRLHLPSKGGFQTLGWRVIHCCIPNRIFTSFYKTEQEHFVNSLILTILNRCIREHHGCMDSTNILHLWGSGLKLWLPTGYSNGDHYSNSQSLQEKWCGTASV